MRRMLISRYFDVQEKKMETFGLIKEPCFQDIGARVLFIFSLKERHYV